MIPHAIVLVVLGLTIAAATFTFGAMSGSGWSIWAALAGAALVGAGTFAVLAKGYEALAANEDDG